MSEQSELHLKTEAERGKDIFLCHTRIDKPWVERLAERIEAEPYQNRLLGVIFDKWDFAKASNIVIDIERELDACRHIGIVVTRALLNADWPTLERSIAVWSDPAGTRGRVIPLLRENVTLPASLRVRNWIDFRDEKRFEEAFAELIHVLRGEQIPRGRGSLLPTVPEIKLPYDPAPVVITSSVGADRIHEQIVSNLFPIIELPEHAFSTDTPLRDKADIHLYSTNVSHPPFLLREGRLWTFTNLRRETGSFGAAVRPKTIREDRFEPWFSDADRARWAVELLNICLKENAWRRFLRLDKDRHRYFFAPRDGQPKKIHWRIGGRWSEREVTARHMVTRRLPDGTKQKFQSGWRHQASRAGFVLLPFGLFLRLEPTWMLTKADGKTPRGGPRVGPILSHWLNQERNGQILRSLRFWSLVMARGKAEIFIPTGQKPIRISLTPTFGVLDFGIVADHRPLKPKDVTMIEGHSNFTQRVGMLLSAVMTEIRALKALDSGPDVVICAMSKTLEDLCRVGIAEYERLQSEKDDGIDPEDLAEIIPEAQGEDDAEESGDETARSFRRGLKAECLNLFPTQLMWYRTLAGTIGVQDLATRAWNLSVALLYKAEIIPWRLSDVIEGSCFVGISFFHEDEARSSTLRTSIAQAFTERGEGFVLQGDSFEWDSRKSGERAPHLNQDQARMLLEKVLQVYADQVGSPPRKVVLHKTSRYTEDERKGFEEALNAISHYGFLAINRRGIICLRPGKKAVLRGTVVDFGQKRGLIYTMGYAPFLRCYPGFRVPQPLEVTENWGSVSLREAAEDILKLTKLNWNTAAFNCRDPITLAFSRRVGDILKMARGKEPALHYRYYM